MRRLRVPTFPNMGLRSSQKGGGALQPSSSAIFADAEEESPRPEKRPSAPHMSGLRKRSNTQGEERYEDATQQERPQENRPSAITRLKTLTSLVGEDAHDVEDDGIELRKKAKRVEAATSLRGSECEQKNVSLLRSEIAPDPRVAGPALSFRTDESTEELRSSPGQMDSSSHSMQDSSNDIDPSPRKGVLSNALKVPMQKATEIASKLRHRLSGSAILQYRAQTGIAFFVTSVLALFSFLKWVFLTFIGFLDKIVIRLIQQGERQIDIRSPDEAAQGNAMHNEERVSTQSNLDVQINAVKGPSTSTSETNTGEVSSVVQTEQNSVVHDQTMAILSSSMTEETIAPLPQLSLSDQPTECVSKDQKGTNEHLSHSIDKASNNSTWDSGDGAKAPSINEKSSKKGYGASGSGSETAATLSQGRSSAENLINELDQCSMRFEQTELEIILSPLDSTTPTLPTDTELEANDIAGTNYLHGRIKIADQSRRQSTEMNPLTRLPGRKRSSRGPTGKLKNEVRTMKGSILRVFGRNKVEPETRFASPRSASKTLALVADMLVREHGCDVAIRRNGALKMRCEKVFPGSQRLRTRLAFQPMDAFSCNVIVCRSREDDLLVSTTDYVAFVADLQRSFLNATSEGMHGTHSG